MQVFLGDLRQRHNRRKTWEEGVVECVFTTCFFTISASVVFVFLIVYIGLVPVLLDELRMRYNRAKTSEREVTELMFA